MVTAVNDGCIYVFCFCALKNTEFISGYVVRVFCVHTNTASDNVLVCAVYLDLCVRESLV